VSEHAADRIRPGRRLVFAAVARAACSAAALLALYFLLPLRGVERAGPIVLLGLGLLAVVALIGWQLRRIMAAAHPLLRGLEALATVSSLFVVLFSVIYYLLSAADRSSFTVGLTRMDALYFTVSVLATVGFGDIAAATAPAKAVVTVQMLADIVLIGAGLRLLLTAARHRRSHPGPASRG
jgi:hypothetical protein